MNTRDKTQRKYVSVECTQCGKQRLFPITEAARDRFADAITAHLLQQHPSTKPTEAERCIEQSLAEADVITTDNAPTEPRRWVYRVV